MQELISPRLPFGLPSGKSLPQSLPYKAKNNYAANISAILSPRISQDDTHMTSMPQVKNHGSGSRFTNLDRSAQKLVIPGSLTLDTDSEADASKLFIREKLMKNNTSRNIRNKTIDVPSLASDYKTPRKGFGNQQPLARSNLGQIQSATRRGVGAKKGSLQHQGNLFSSVNSPIAGSNRQLFVEGSMDQLLADHGNQRGNISLPQI